MSLLITIFAVLIVFLIGGLVLRKVLRSRKKGIRTRQISVCEITEIYRQMTTQAVETSFAVFIIAPRQREMRDTVEVQFSVENGVIGLDWILMSKSNQQEKQLVILHALENGAEWQECEMNGWVYLRIEKGDVVGLCVSLIKNLYAVEDVQLKYGGFEYN